MYTFYTFTSIALKRGHSFSKVQKGLWHKEQRISQTECVHYRYNAVEILLGHYYYWYTSQKIPEDGDHPQSIVSSVNPNVNVTVSQGGQPVEMEPVSFPPLNKGVPGV